MCPRWEYEAFSIDGKILYIFQSVLCRTLKVICARTVVKMNKLCTGVLGGFFATQKNDENFKKELSFCSNCK